MKRPLGVGQLMVVALVFGIILLWVGHASAVLIYDITIVEPTTPGPDVAGAVVGTIVRTNTTTGASQTANVAGGNEDLQFTITSFAGTAPTADFVRVIRMLEPGQSSDVSDVVRFTIASGSTSLVVAFVSDDSSHFAEFVALTPDVSRNEPEIGFLDLTSDVQGFGGPFLNIRSFQAASEVPEPGTLFLLGSGLVGVGTLWRRRRHS